MIWNLKCHYSTLRWTCYARLWAHACTHTHVCMWHVALVLCSCEVHSHTKCQPNRKCCVQFMHPHIDIKFVSRSLPILVQHSEPRTCFVDLKICFTYVDHCYCLARLFVSGKCAMWNATVWTSLLLCVCVCVCVSQCCGFLFCTFVGLLKSLRTLHFHVVSWSASLNASPRCRNVTLMERPEGNAIHILLFLYFPAMVRFDKVAMRCILNVPTGTWLCTWKENKCSKGVTSVLRDEGLWREWRNSSTAWYTDDITARCQYIIVIVHFSNYMNHRPQFFPLHVLINLFPCHGSTALLGLGLFFEVPRSHSVGLLWTSDRPVAETSTWQHTILTRDKRSCPQRDSNLQSQQASGCRPTATAIGVI
jgi:hypothetical protein